MRGTWMRMLGGALVIGLLAGCNDTTTEVVQPETPNVMGFVLQNGGPKAMAPVMDVAAYVGVSEAPVTPGVTLNGTPLALDPEYSMYANGFGFSGVAAPRDDGRAEIAIAMGSLAAACSVPVPGVSDWVSPEFGEVTVTPGAPATLTWAAADGAEGYWLTCRFEVDYTDTAGVYRTWENQFSTFMTGTTSTLTAAQMLPPADIVASYSYSYFYGDGDLFPYAGPLAQGSQPNVTGDAAGAIIGLSAPLDLDFSLAAVPTKADVGERDLDDLLRSMTGR